MRSSLALAALAAASMSAAAPAVDAPPQVRTAWYWEARGRDDRAAEAWQEALRLGDRADALAAVGAWHGRAGRVADARAMLARLSRRWPGSPEAAQLEQAIAVGTRHQALLARARDAARAGRLDDALARYRELFGPAAPPGHLAAEYYEACAGVPRAQAEAIAGFEELSRRVPAHPRYRLSLARALTYRPETRLDGVTRLEALVDDRAVGPEADAALRKALAWLPPGPETETHLARWLARHPADTEVAGVAAQHETAGTVEAGYAALARGDLDAARARFAEAGSSDAHAVGGLAVIALRERDYGAAKALAERAREMAPADVATWQATLRTATFWDLVTRGRAATAAGRYDEARGLLSEAGAQPMADRREAELALADLDDARGARADAEARLRVLAQAHPRDGTVLRRLVDALARGGKNAEALKVNEQLARVAPALAADVRPLRAAELRAKATALRADGDPAGARQALLAAHELDRLDPWSLHDLAQLALEKGDLDEARRWSRALTALEPDLPATRAVEARVAARSGDPATAIAALDAIPVAARDASLEALRRRVEVEAALAEAAKLPRVTARERLGWAEGRAGGDPELLAAVGRGWRKAGDHRRAAGAFREALKRSSHPPASLRLELAAALAEREGADDEVAEMVEALRDEPGLTVSERDAARDLATGIAVRRADAMRERGDTAGALAALAPVLERDPDEPRLLAARARALLAAGDAAGARVAFRRALAEDPSSVDARAGAVTVALALRDVDEARRIASDGAARAPADGRTGLLLARAELGRGDDAAALRALHAARAAGPAPAIAGGEDVPTAIQAEIDRISARHALEADGGVVLRARDGEPGLGALTEVRAPFGAAVPAGLAGRFVFLATPVTLDAGRGDPSTGDVASRFGSGAAAGPGLVRASGVELRGRWEQRGFSAELGTTPLGFLLRNVVGGVRLALPAGPVDLAMRLSRREVTDSVLSYAGVRDPATGEVWGGVVRDEVRLDASWHDAESSRWGTVAASVLHGTGVAQNAELSAGAGADWAVGRALGGVARAGLSAAALGYSHNQRYFTLGQGGYFSPQTLVHAGVPFSLRGGGQLAWEIGGEAGLNWFREDAAPGAGGAAGFPGRGTAGIALDARSSLRWALKAGLDARADLEAHHADGYQEVRASFGVSWRLWAPR